MHAHAQAVFTEQLQLYWYLYCTLCQRLVTREWTMIIADRERVALCSPDMYASTKSRVADYEPIIVFALRDKKQEQGEKNHKRKEYK